MGESEKSEILMILQPRAIPEAIESLNKLDIEKVWFRGMTEELVCEKMNDFVKNTNYDYYWVIADDVVVDDKPLEVLRPILYQDKVVTGYCQMAQETEVVNIMHKPIKIYQYNEHPMWHFHERIRRYKKEEYDWMDRFPIEGDDMNTWAKNQLYDIEYASCYDLNSVKDMPEDVFPTYLAGWSFTAAPRKVWLEYPFQVSPLGAQSDAQFTIRYINHRGNKIYTHKEAFFTHLKEGQTDVLRKDWLVGEECGVIHYGLGHLNREDILRKDIYWDIADDVIVDNLPLQVLRPMLDKYEVVSGYCKWYEDCDYVNLLHSPIQCVYGGEHETYGFLKQLNRAIPSRNAWINRIPPKKPEGEEVWDFMFYDMWHEQSCFKVEEIEDRENPEIETYFSGWSFTGASRKIWLNYPFECSVMDCQSDIQFSIRYINRDGGIIHSHKDAYFIHLKKNTDVLMSEWLVGVEAPITYLGKGKIHREDIGMENIWEDESKEFLPSTNPDIHSGKTRLTDL